MLLGDMLVDSFKAALQLRELAFSIVDMHTTVLVLHGAMIDLLMAGEVLTRFHLDLIAVRQQRNSRIDVLFQCPTDIISYELLYGLRAGLPVAPALVVRLDDIRFIRLDRAA